MRLSERYRLLECMIPFFRSVGWISFLRAFAPQIRPQLVYRRRCLGKLTVTLAALLVSPLAGLLAAATPSPIIEPYVAVVVIRRIQFAKKDHVLFTDQLSHIDITAIKKREKLLCIINKLELAISRRREI